MMFTDYLRAFPQWFVGTFERTDVDVTALPAELLELIKAQIKVKHDADDDLIKKAIFRAIGQIEAGAGLVINPSTWVMDSGQWPADWSAWWSGYWGSWASGTLPILWLPLAPVDTVKIEAGGADVTSDWTLRKQTDTTGVTRTAIVNSNGYITQYGTPATLTLACGYDTANDLPPLVLDAILQITATKYQTRESANVGNVQELPDFDGAVLGPLWQPRA